MTSFSFAMAGKVQVKERDGKAAEYIHFLSPTWAKYNRGHGGGRTRAPRHETPSKRVAIAQLISVEPSETAVLSHRVLTASSLLLAMEKSGIKLTLKKSKVVQKLSPDEVDGSSPLSAAPASPPHVGIVFNPSTTCGSSFQ
jgi:hypothetical protein